MAKYPTITDTSATKWNLPSSNGDNLMDVYVLNKNAGGEVAYMVFIIKNTALDLAGTELDVSSISFTNPEADDLGLTLNPTAASNIELGHSTTIGNKLKAPEADTDNTNSSNFSGANRILCIPGSGNITPDDLGNEAAPYRIIPIYDTNYITAGNGATNPIPDNSYAAFIVKYNPSSTLVKNTNTSLLINTSAGNQSFPLDIGAFNSFSLGFSYGDYNSSTGVLDNASTSINSGGSINLGMIPVGAYSDSQLQQSFITTIDKDISIQDISLYPSAYKFHTWAKIGDNPTLNFSLLEDFGLKKADTNHNLGFISANQLSNQHPSGTVLYSTIKLTEGGKSKSFYNNNNNMDSFLTRSKSDNTFSFQLRGFLSDTDDESAYGVRAVNVTLGVYDRLSMPAGLADFNGIHNQSTDDAEGSNNIPEIIKTNDSATSLYSKGFCYLDLMFTYSNFGKGDYNQYYAEAAFAPDSKMKMYNYAQGSDGDVDVYSYSNMSDNVYDKDSLALELDSGTAASTTTTYWEAPSTAADYQKSIGVRYKVTPSLSYQNIYGSNEQPNEINSAGGSGSRTEYRFGKYTFESIASPDDASTIFKHLHQNYLSKVKLYPRPSELRIVNKLNPLINTHNLQGVATIHDGTSVEYSATSLYGVNSSVVVPNTSAAWDSSDRYLGYDGAYKTGCTSTSISTGARTFNPTEPYILDQNGSDINSFTPSSSYYTTNAKLNVETNNWEAFIDFTFENLGDNNIFVYDVEVIDSDLLPVASTSLSPNGEDLWYVGNGTGVNSNFTTTTHDFSSGSHGTGALWNNISSYLGYVTDKNNCFIKPDTYQDPSNLAGTENLNHGYFSVRFVGTQNGSVAGDYYKSVRVRYYKDIYSNRKKVNSDGSVESRNVFQARKHEAIVLVKVTVAPEAILQISDADTTSIASGTTVEVGALNIG